MDKQSQELWVIILFYISEHLAGGKSLIPIIVFSKMIKDRKAQDVFANMAVDIKFKILLYTQYKHRQENDAISLNLCDCAILSFDF